MVQCRLDVIQILTEVDMNGSNTVKTYLNITEVNVFLLIFIFDY